MTRTKLAYLAVGTCILFLLTGCGDPPAKGYEKKDFEKTPPPAGYLNSVPKAPPGPPPGTPGQSK